MVLLHVLVIVGPIGEYFPTCWACDLLFHSLCPLVHLPHMPHGGPLGCKYPLLWAQGAQRYLLLVLSQLMAIVPLFSGECFPTACQGPNSTPLHGGLLSERLLITFRITRPQLPQQFGDLPQRRYFRTYILNRKRVITI